MQCVDLHRLTVCHWGSLRLKLYFVIKPSHYSVSFYHADNCTKGVSGLDKPRWQPTLQVYSILHWEKRKLHVTMSLVSPKIQVYFKCTRHPPFCVAKYYSEGWWLIGTKCVFNCRRYKANKSFSWYIFFLLEWLTDKLWLFILNCLLDIFLKNERGQAPVTEGKTN